MNKTVSAIYANSYVMTPFHPDAVYRQCNEGRVESELVRDAMFLKQKLHVTYEQAMRRLDGRADRFDRRDCEDALAKQLAVGERKVCNRLRTICNRYSIAA